MILIQRIDKIWGLHVVSGILCVMNLPYILATHMELLSLLLNVPAILHVASR